MNLILEKLKYCKNRESTTGNYLNIWRVFNKFIIRLDRKPDAWEDRVSLFCAYLINNGRQSATVKSYVSAIKCILTTDGYSWDDSKILLTTLVRSCRMINDRVKTRLPIRIGLLEILLHELEIIFSNQLYLETLYKAMFLLGYHGLFRVGELTKGDHVIKAADVHIAGNKEKILIVLHTSKTHGWDSYPQEIKISGTSNTKNLLFCPFKASREYLAIRGNYRTTNEQFFVFSDQSPVAPQHFRAVLKTTLKNVNLNPTLYNCHSLRIGATTDMVLKYNKSIFQAKLAGRWRSNAVFKYIKNC